MLYDKKWDAKFITADVSLAGFIAWLETKDPKGCYQFMECEGRCLLGQYMSDIDIPWTGAPDKASGNWDKSSYTQTARQIFGSGRDVRFTVLSRSPHTFGGALERARAYQRSL
jgi:hypothetical protein